MLRFIPINSTQAVAKIIFQTKQESRNRFLIYTLDVSGSMAGKPLDNAKAGLIEALKRNVDNFQDITVVIYSNIAHKLSVDKQNLSFVISEIEKLRADNCTSFTNMFTAVESIIWQKLVQHKNNVDVYLYVFSDGKHFPGYQEPVSYGYNPSVYQQELTKYKNLMEDDEKKLQVASDKLKFTMQTINANSRTYCKTRAFSNDVDVLQMELLTTFGTEQGDFRYAFSAAEISDILASDPLLNVKSISGDLVFQNKRVRIEFYSGNSGNSENNRNNVDSKDYKSEEVGVYEGSVNMTIDDLADGLPSVEINDKKVNLVIDMVPDTPENAVEIFDAFLTNFAVRLKDLSSTLVRADGDKESINKQVITLKTLDDEMTKTYEQRYPTLRGRVARKTYGTKYIALRKELHSITESALSLLKGSTTGTLARILHAGHQVSSKGLQNRLNTLSLAGINKIEESEKKLMELGQTQDQTAIKQRLQNVDIRCMISLSDVCDAVLDQDMICMTGFMSRSESAIGSSDQIRIQEINSLENSILWSVFCDELLSKLDGLSYDDKAKSVHGGFNAKSKKTESNKGVMQNAYRGTINFAYPLYINSDHWTVAKHYMPQVVAWMPTLDFAAQTFEQMKTVPFVMVLSSMLELIDGPSDANIQKFMNVARVAKQLVVDYNMTHILEDYNRWLASYEGRVPKNISNITIFLVKLLFHKDIILKLNDDFWCSVLEEQTRRYLGSLVKVENQQAIYYIPSDFAANQCNYLNYVDVARVQDKDDLYYARLVDKNAQVEQKANYVAAKFEEENVVLQNDQINALLDKFTEKFMPTFTILNKVRKFLLFAKTVSLEELFDSLDSNLGIVNDKILAAFGPLREEKQVDQKISSSLYETYKITKEQFYSMLILNQKHVDNKSREESKLEPVNVRNPKTVIKEEVERCIQAEQSRRLAELQNSSDRKLAEKFINTDDIRVAAGIIRAQCFNVGTQIFKPLLVGMQELEVIPHRFEKIKMLVNGQWNGIQLYRPNYVYPANKRNRGRLIYAYNWEVKNNGLPAIDCATWNELFRWITDRQY